jgi:hypothetical protein
VVRGRHRPPISFYPSGGLSRHKRRGIFLSPLHIYIFEHAQADLLVIYATYGWSYDDGKHAAVAAQHGNTNHIDVGRRAPPTLRLAHQLLRDVMEDYATNTDTETLLVKRYQGVGNDVAALKGARFVSAAEVEQGRRLAESKVKQLTGRDAVTARFLFGEPFNFTPEFS